MKEIEEEIQAKIKTVNEAAGIKESDTGLAIPALWDLAADKQALQTEEPLQVHITHLTHTHTHTHHRSLSPAEGSAV